MFQLYASILKKKQNTLVQYSQLYLKLGENCRFVEYLHHWVKTGGTEELFGGKIFPYGGSGKHCNLKAKN